MLFISFGILNYMIRSFIVIFSTISIHSSQASAVILLYARPSNNVNKQQSVHESLQIPNQVVLYLTLN